MTNTINRGIQAVRAEADVAGLIPQLATAFTDVKAAQNDRVTAIEKQLELDATKAAYGEMHGTSTAPKSKFLAHYAQKPDFQASDPAFRGAVAIPYSGAFYFRVPREVLADATGLNEAIVTMIAQSFGLLLDGAALRGVGTAPTPRGLLSTPNVHQITSGAAGAALAGYSKFFEATAAILGADHGMPTAAIMAPRSLVKLGGLQDTTNQPLRVPTMLENMRLLATSQIPTNLTVGGSTDCSEIYIGDFTQMKLVMRETVSIQLLRESFALTGELAFVGHVRADVVVSRPKSFAIVTGVRP